MSDILITRPIAQAHATARHIKKLGHKPYIVPLVEIIPFEFSVPDRNFDALLATSRHAFGVSREDELAVFRQLPLFCVGKSTQTAAVEAGFTNLVTVAETATQLVSALKYHPTCHFLYLAGNVRRPVLEQGLKMLGHQVCPVETYQQRPIFPDSTHLAGLPLYFDSVLFYSSMSAQQTSYLADFFKDTTRFICLSARIAHALPLPFQAHTHIATHPNEASLLALL